VGWPLLEKGLHPRLYLSLPSSDGSDPDSLGEAVEKVGAVIGNEMLLGVDGPLKSGSEGTPKL